MKFLTTMAVVALACTATQAKAQDRAGPAALGALSGAVVLGPVGLVAGAVIGYTAGPSIGRAWKIERGQPRHRAQAKARPARTARASTPKARGAQPEAGVVTPMPKGPGTGGPPPQGLE